MESVDVVIRNGRVIDPDNDIDDVLDVAVKGGKISAVGKDLQVNAKSSFNANGYIVTPGLIDAHVHCYEYATPLGINPDDRCLSRGVTTIVDAGSAGSCTFPGLRKYIMEKSRTRVLCLLHIAKHGLAAATLASAGCGGESDTFAILDEDSCRQCLEENRDVIIGVKVRLTANVCGEGKTEEAAFRRALAVAETCNVPLMVHHGSSLIPTQRSEGPDSLGAPGSLRPGDIYTHTYHGHASSILDPDSRKILSDVIDARSRGVLFDVGHGRGAFHWTVAELCAKNNFWPDLMGTDLHVVNQDGPVYDMPTVMTKFLHLGMDVNEIIRSSTSAPAHAYKLDDVIGSLSVGKDADITVLNIEDCDVQLEDCHGQTRNVKRRINPVAVWRAGESFPVTKPEPWPNMESRKKTIVDWFDPGCLIIKDDIEPTL